MPVISAKKKNEAIEILKSYNGKNQQLLKFQSTYKWKGTVSDYDVEYILCNHMKEEETFIGRTVKIAAWYGQELEKRYQIDFTPQKLYIHTLVGETSVIYHCYVKYRRSQTECISLYIPKRSLLEPMIKVEWKDYPVDVDRINSLLVESGRKLKEHQVEGIRFLLGMKKCILADDMGLGKSLTSLSSAYYGDFNKILIICPASMKTTWKKEISFFGIDDVEIIEGTDREKWDLSKKYTIINYDIFDKYGHEVAYTTIIDEYSGKPKKVKSKNKAVIEELNSKNPLIQANFDLLIMDEAHRLSNSTSNRYKAITDYIKRSGIENIWELTGTPVSNNSKNFYNLLSLIGAEVSLDYNYYVTRYCGGRKMKLKTGREILVPMKDTNLEELHNKTSHIYLRRLKSELKDLPEKIIKEIYYDLTPVERKEYDNLWTEYENKKIELGDVDYDTLDNLNRDLVEGGVLRRWLSLSMVPHTIELCNECFKNDPNCKIVIGCFYDNELYALRDHFKDLCVIYNGKLTPKEKDRSQEEFNNNPEKKVFIGNIISSGVGINLVSANCLIFNTFDFVPANNNQFIDRIYRIGQTKNCVAYFQFFNQSYNEYMWNTLIRKMMNIDSLIKEEKNK
jgi:SWI/SNF-related matrix-associated actin-dependent regulator 1 of chromatin subfamily A